MGDTSRSERIHNLDVTLWVGKNGIDADTETLARELGDRVDATVVETRGHTAVLEQ
jgi:RNA-binding protein